MSMLAICVAIAAMPSIRGLRWVWRAVFMSVEWDSGSVSVDWFDGLHVHAGWTSWSC